MRTTTIALAAASYALWLLVLIGTQPERVVDEKGHHRAVVALAEGEKLPSMPMLPGYHWALAAPSMVVGTSLPISRILTTLLSGGLVLGFAALSGVGRRSPVLLIAWLPILWPYVTLVYTDAASAGLVGLAAAGMLRGRHGVAAALILAACLVRQSNLVWVIFLAGWMVLNQLRVARRAGLEWTAFARSLIQPICPYVIVGLVPVMLAVTGAGVLASDTPGNRPRPNVGNFYLLGFALVGLWAPLLAQQLRPALRWAFAAARRSPAQSAVVGLAVLTSVAALALTYDIPHSWNTRLYFLHNKPLVAMGRSMPVRLAGIVIALMGFLLTARLAWMQPRRDVWVWLAVTTALFLLPHSAAEHRYLIVPFLLGTLLLDLTARQERRLALWYGTMNLVVGALLVSGRAFP